MADEPGLLDRLAGRKGLAEALLTAPGFWVDGTEIDDGETPPGISPAVRRPRYLLRVEPGAPLPPGVDADAPRYVVEVQPVEPPRHRGLLAGAGVVVLMAGMTGMVVGYPWAFLPALAGATMAGAAVANEGTERLTFRRSDDGEWVEARGELPYIPPVRRYTTGDRIVLGVLAAMALALAAVVGIGAGELLVLLLVGTLGTGLAWCALVDSLPIRRQSVSDAIRAELRFHELADPTRPLSPGDLALPFAQPALPASAADVTSRRPAAIQPSAADEAAGDGSRGPGGQADEDAFTRNAASPPATAPDHAPVQHQRFRGLAAGSDRPDSALDRALDSIDLTWLAEVSVVKVLAIPVGLGMGIGWLAGSLSLGGGVLGIALVVAGVLTLLHAWSAHRDAGGGDAGHTGVRRWVGAMLGYVGELELTMWALLAAAVGTWWFSSEPEGAVVFGAIIMLAVIADAIIAIRRDDA